VTLPAESAGQVSDYWNDILSEIYDAGNVTTYVDEVYLLKSEGEGFPPMLSHIVTNGRELGLGLWSAAQRPSWIPRVLISESEHVFAFTLLLEDDRAAMAKNLHPGLAEEIPQQDEHGYRYWSLRDRKPQYFDGHEEDAPGEGLGDLGDLVDEESELEREESC
jgi:hypothetical protein